MRIELRSLLFGLQAIYPGLDPAADDVDCRLRWLELLSKSKMAMLLFAAEPPIMTTDLFISWECTGSKIVAMHTNKTSCIMRSSGMMDIYVRVHA